MGFDWIKIEKATPQKPEILALSELLEIHPVHAFGLCVRFWIWCDDQLLDGNAKNVTKVTLDYVIQHAGFADALVTVGWLRDRSGSLEVPHFDRHLSEGSKNRALTKERVRKSKEKSNVKNVTELTHGALLEKRREDSTKSLSPRGSENVDEAIAFAAGKPGWNQDTVRQWFAERQSQGWLKSSGLAITNWQSDLEAWIMREAQGNSPSRSNNGPRTRQNSKAAPAQRTSKFAFKIPKYDEQGNRIESED